MDEHLIPSRDALLDVCGQLRLDATGLEPVRVAANAVWRLPALGVVAKVYPEGYIYEAEAALGVINAKWLHRNGISTIVPWRSDIALSSSGRPVSFWNDLGAHRESTPQEMGAMVRTLRLVGPGGMEKLSDPMPRAHMMVSRFHWIEASERRDLHERVSRAKKAWRALVDNPEIPVWEVSHGCVYPGNIVVPEDGRTTILNVERLRVAPAGYDAATMANKALVIGQYDPQVYRDFSDAYGEDITQVSWYPQMEDVVRIRAALYAVQVGNHHVAARDLARYRMECLLGQHGEGPWVWKPLPVGAGNVPN